MYLQKKECLIENVINSSSLNETTLQFALHWLISMVLNLWLQWKKSAVGNWTPIVKNYVKMYLVML